MIRYNGVGWIQKEQQGNFFYEDVYRKVKSQYFKRVNTGKELHDSRKNDKCCPSLMKPNTSSVRFLNKQYPFVYKQCSHLISCYNSLLWTVCDRPVAWSRLPTAFTLKTRPVQRTESPAPAPALPGGCLCLQLSLAYGGEGVGISKSLWTALAEFVWGERAEPAQASLSLRGRLSVHLRC